VTEDTTGAEVSRAAGADDADAMAAEEEEATGADWTPDSAGAPPLPLPAIVTVTVGLYVTVTGAAQLLAPASETAVADSAGAPPAPEAGTVW